MKVGLAETGKRDGAPNGVVGEVVGLSKYAPCAPSIDTDMLPEHEADK